MKKRIFSALLCLCILFVITLIAADAPNAWPDTEEGREGMILVLQKETCHKDGKKSYSMKYKYDSRGRLIRTICYAPDVGRKLYGELEYDENDNIIRGHQEYAYDDDIYWESKYDANGNILQTTLYNKCDGSVSRIKYEYDTEGKLLMETENRIREDYSEGRMLRQECYEYDEQGNRIRDISVYDQASWQSEYGYDIRGNMVWEINYDSDHNILSRCRYEYDTQDKLTREYIFNDFNGDMHRQYQYEYDAQGNEISRTDYFVFEDRYVVDHFYTFSRKYVWITVE